MREAAGATLGPRWTPKELRSFYILLKVHGEQWERLEELLPGRSAAMMRALFDMHRGYLALPEASADGFCAVMTDHYEAQKDPEAVAMAYALSMSAVAGGDAAGGVKIEPRLASPDANAAGLRKRESLGGDATARRDGETPKIKKKRRLDKLLSLDSGDQLEQQTIEQLRIRSESDAEMPDASGEGGQASDTGLQGLPGRVSLFVRLDWRWLLVKRGLMVWFAVSEPPSDSDPATRALVAAGPELQRSAGPPVRPAMVLLVLFVRRRRVLPPRRIRRLPQPDGTRAGESAIISP